MERQLIIIIEYIGVASSSSGSGSDYFAIELAAGRSSDREGERREVCRDGSNGRCNWAMGASQHTAGNVSWQGCIPCGKINAKMWHSETKAGRREGAAGRGRME